MQEQQAQEALIARYDQRIPRYTSYPMAPHFSNAIGSSDYAAWLGSLDNDASLSIYLHVPFCAELCYSTRHGWRISSESPRQIG